ncbi:DUF2877 domain-containing protein [Desulfosporosinus sp. Sb-LF]|uniref:oxamate carbamoyltransferase subunit AllH family protein n=1 Tax=Desulfosporosinus sp. Sb-LF TaxID=2560027 RepID=UPI00107F9B67|nr:DUF2877 domain-containing protein [Desulfosporosinus sp. Sb-LF]TGE31510.1 DUF2877 domain-containing protein [Desulfosporosinus sp. Sb-LF]
MFLNPLKAVSIGPSAFRSLNGDMKKGKVHTVFRRVINIVWPDGNLSSISRVDVSNGPANIVTSLPVTSDFTHYGIEPGTLVRLDSDLTMLNIGSLSVSLKNATLWESPIAHFGAPLPLSQIKANLVEVGRWVNLTNSTSSGLTKLFPHLESLRSGTYLPPSNTDPVTFLAGQAINSLLPALRTADRTSIKESASSLIGLGPGLTPSGDDYLAGLLLSLAAAAKLLPESFTLAQNELSNTVIGLAPGLTNDLSYQMLLFAARETGSELMENMVVALFCATQTKSSLIQAAVDLSAVGASSGFDQLLGIMSGASLYSGCVLGTGG